MTSKTSKTGRPTAVHKTAGGDRIPGLMRLKDGRWRVSGPEKTTYTEPDERLAVARFHQIMAGRNPNPNIGKAKVHTKFDAAFHDAWQRAHLVGRAEIGSPAVNEGMLVVTDDSLTPEQWAWLRNKIIDEPKWVAQRVGIEEIGYLTDLKQPTTSPTLQEIGDLYVAKPSLSPNEASRSRLFWKEFTQLVGVATIREITHEHVERYEKALQGGDYAPKSILHRYRKVRTVLAFAIKRGRGAADCRRVLDITAMLEVKNAAPLDPKPITVNQFWKMHKAASDAGDSTFAAMLLTALNCCMYPGEVSALRWDEIDTKIRELVSRRPKTGVSRVAVLWPCVIKAIAKLPRVGEYVFNTRVRSYTVFSALGSWRKYRTGAELPEDVVFGQIRDAGYTIACKVNLDQARVIAGHRLPGMADNYVRRDPQFVAEACKAIGKAFDTL